MASRLQAGQRECVPLFVNVMLGHQPADFSRLSVGMEGASGERVQSIKKAQMPLFLHCVFVVAAVYGQMKSVQFFYCSTCSAHLVGEWLAGVVHFCTLSLWAGIL